MCSLYLIRLLDIVHADQKLYLVFEFLDVDLKRFMEQCNSTGGMTMDLVKVSYFVLCLLMSILSFLFLIRSDDARIAPSGSTNDACSRRVDRVPHLACHIT
jgi:hypothetical protein